MAAAPDPDRNDAAPGTPGGPPRLRLALTLPGAVSLGAYQGGALAALLVAAQHADGQIVVDAMATASAGSISGVLATRALQRGADPVALMTSAWVTGDSLQALRSTDVGSVLSVEPLRSLAADLLSPDGSVPDGDPAIRQTDPVRISMAVASLGGLSYRVPSLDADQPWFSALTHLDRWDHRFDAAATDEEFGDAVEPALASAANALGFPPVLLDRSADREAYIANHILGVPPPGEPWPVWYTDGGTLDDEPFGRAIDMVLEAVADPGSSAAPGGDDRVFLLIEPLPATVDHASRWWDPETVPHWTFTLFDTFNLKGAQSIYDDLRRLQKTNSRVRWTGRATTALIEGLTTALDAVDPARRDEVAAAITASLDAAMTDIEGDRQDLRDRQDGHDEPAPISTAPTDGTPAEPAPLGEVVSQLLQQATGLNDRIRARVEMVSPLIDADQRPVDQRLAGDFLFHFGGFVNEAFRRHDFLVGWSNMRSWLGAQAGDHHLEEAMVEVDRRLVELGWELVDDNPSLGSLSLGDKWSLGRIAAHVGRVITHDVLSLADEDEDER